MDLISLRKEAEAIENPALKQDALREIKKLEDGIQMVDDGYARIQKEYAEKLVAPRVSRFKLALITALFGVMAYWFARYGFFRVLQAGGYTERHTGLFITATSAPISYWFGLGFFGFGAAFMSLSTLGGVLAFFTYPVPLLHWIKERRRRNGESKP